MNDTTYLATEMDARDAEELDILCYVSDKALSKYRVVYMGSRLNFSLYTSSAHQNKILFHE